MPDKKIFGPRLFNRVLLYLLGNYVISFGLILIAKANIGITPVNSIPFTISKILSRDLGLMTTITYLFLILTQFIILGKKFHPINLLQIVFSSMYGSFISLNTRILFFFTPQTYWLQLLIVAVSVVICSFGIFLYLKANLIPLPPDGLNLAIEKKTGWKLHNIKMLTDTIFVATAIIVSLCAAGKIIGIREGTVLMLASGKIMGLFSKHLGSKIDKLIN